MNLSQLAIKNLARRPVRAALGVIGIGSAVTMIVALVGISHALESAFLKLYTAQNVDLVVQRRGGAVQLSKGLSMAFADQVRKIDGVEEVVSGLMDMVSFEEHDLFMVIVNGWELNCPVLQRVRLLEGRKFQTGDQRHVMLGKVLAAQLNKRPGETVELYSQPFEVIGIFESFSIYENGAVFLLIDELQRQIDRPGQLTGLVVQVRPHGDAMAIARVQQEIERLDDEVAATRCSEFVQGLKQMRVARAAANCVALIATVLGACALLNTMAMSVYERRREFGILRALGWRPRRIVGLIVRETLGLTAMGTVAGVGLGWLVPRVLANWPPTAVLVDGTISSAGIIAGVTLALVATVFGSLYPAYYCATIPPADAIRGSR